MKHTIIVAIAFVMSFSAFAENTCPAKLTYGHERDSISYTIDMDDLDIRDYGSDHLAHSISIIRALLKMKGCARADINFKETPIGRYALSRCKLVVPNVETSRICYVESSIGFFNVSWDMLTNVHIVYNRWD